MTIDVNAVRANVRKATTEDLLDRVTVFQQGMEREALEIIKEELRKRGVTPADQDAHLDRRNAEALPALPDGTVPRCSFCNRPAVRTGWGWHRLWGKVPDENLARRAFRTSWGLHRLLGVLPVFPRRFNYCSEHLPR